MFYHAYLFPLLLFTKGGAAGRASSSPRPLSSPGSPRKCPEHGVNMIS